MNALVAASGFLAGLSLLAGLLVLTPAGWAGDGPTSARNVTQVGRLDIEGGGMVDVRGTLAVIGHMSPPHATSILDVSDPAQPRLLARIPVKPGTHSHKARLCGRTLITNHAAWFSRGLRVIDISNPYLPSEVGHYVPAPVKGNRFAMSNDVFVDSQDLIYLIDRHDGLEILRFARRP